MMRITGRRALGMGLVLTMLTTTGVVVAPSVTGASSSSSSTTFGTLPSPCGKGHATGATDQGVTNSTINIAYGDDRGFSGFPGLDQEMGDAVKAMVAWCNAQGGINGRKIVGDYYDAAVTQVGNVMTQACKTDFMLVGEGFALDGLAEGTRLGCNLAAVPGFTVSPVVANAYEMYQASPNPANHSPVSIAYEGEKLFGHEDPARGLVRLHPLHAAGVDDQSRRRRTPRPAGSSSTARSCSTTTARPTTRRSCRSSRAAGPRSSSTTRTPGPTLYGALQAENQIGYNPIWLMDAAEYTEGFAQWNTSGLANNVYVRETYEPLEAAKVVPAVAQYLSILKKYGGLTAALGEQSTSSFLLWATEAKACGSTLTRQCMINHLSKVTSWTGGGLERAVQPRQEPPAVLWAAAETRTTPSGCRCTRRRSGPSSAHRSTSLRTRDP